jgi:hypothetical protein
VSNRPSNRRSKKSKVKFDSSKSISTEAVGILRERSFVLGYERIVATSRFAVVLWVGYSVGMVNRKTWNP